MTPTNGADPAGGALVLLLFAIGAHIFNEWRLHQEQKARKVDISPSRNDSAEGDPPH